jgi:hypothetical protein
VQPVSCSHVFHLECVAREQRCPICRTRFLLSRPSNSIVSRHQACMDVWRIIARSRQFREQVHQVMGPLTADEWMRIILKAYEDYGDNVERAFMAEVQPSEDIVRLIVEPRQDDENRLANIGQRTSESIREMSRQVDEYLQRSNDPSQTR